ncbi:10487_t:CDS:2 [Paraglomus brasilianum]|uniref:10487_t:CDS:1 n=1 Tax=Paraglomus brasilianum TaxID=144538 RepID=A0A9N9FQY4_9GLOM|nr:10487_t:CDS:2 [Paraglomus brasilianum]
MNKEKEIITKFKEYLETKEIFLNTRQITIENLRKICNELETSVNIGKHAKIEEKGKLISASGNAFNSLTFGIIKALKLEDRLEVEEMKKTIELLNENRKELKSELGKEQKWFVNLKERVNDPTKNDVSEKISSGGDIP